MEYKSFPISGFFLGATRDPAACSSEVEVIVGEGSKLSSPTQAGLNATHSWVQTSGTSVLLTGDDTESPTFTAPTSVGTLVFVDTITTCCGTYMCSQIVNVVPDNAVPKAVDDSYTTEMNTPITLDVLDNDSDEDGDTLAIESFTPPTNGQVTQDDNGNLVYTPNPDWSGTDTFTYVVSDGQGGTATATVTIKVPSCCEKFTDAVSGLDGVVSVDSNNDFEVYEL